MNPEWQYSYCIYFMLLKVTLTCKATTKQWRIQESHGECAFPYSNFQPIPATSELSSLRKLKNIVTNQSFSASFPG